MKTPVNFLFELGMLKKIEHCGTKFAGVKHPDTLGEHTCRSAQIGCLLALEENGNPERVSSMCIFHDIGEIRIGDTHRIAQKYLKTSDAERKAIQDQTKNLSSPAKKFIRELADEFRGQKTKNAVIARDADLLETIIQAKEYLDIGYRAASRWLTNGGKYLKTKTAKKWFSEISKTGFADWWDNLNTA